MSEIISLGLWIKRRRKALDLTQDDLARRIGCSLDTIRKIESDARRPSRQIAALLAEQLELAAEERAPFIQAARAQIGVDRLAPPTQSVARSAFVAAPAVAAATTNAPQAAPAPQRNNLPTQPTTLIGRERELAEIVALLRRPDARLVTLSGPGGIGKTRLGLQAAEELASDFADGVFFVDLAPIREHKQVAGAIALAVHLRESGPLPLLDQLRAFLHDKHMLLLLDNFEHVIDAAPLAADLLASAPYLKLLITSREILRVRGEREHAVQPLALPEMALQSPMHTFSADIAQYAAVALFVERAQDSRPDFRLTHANAPAVAEICARLDGLPLAIELAAARLRLFTPEALLARLSSRLGVLTAGPRDLPARQQTLRNTISWSYDLLNPTEQTLFRRFGVFVGGCTLAAAEEVLLTEGSELGDAALRILGQTVKGKTRDASLDSRATVLEGVAALAEKSLLRRAEEANGEARFSMLETIREYALEQLEASSEAESVHRQHARFYLEFSSEQATEDENAWTHRVDADYDNLIAALAWSQTAMGNSEATLRLALALVSLWFDRGVRQEAITTLQRALDHPLGVGRTALHMHVRHQLAQLLGYTGNYGAAQAEYEQTLELARHIEDAWMTPWVLSRIGWLAREQGDSATAWPHFSEALAIYREQGNAEGLAWGLITVAEVAILDEDATHAEELLAESNTLWPNDGSNWWSLWNGWRLNHLGHAAQLRSDYNRAADRHQQALAIFRSLGEQHFGLPWAYHSLGETTLGQNSVAEAVRWFQQGMAMSRQLSDQASIAWCLAGLGTAAALDEEPERAARLWAAAEKARQSIGCRPAPAARATYERALAQVRAELSAEEWSQEWAAGQALTLDEAIAEALETRA